MFFTYHDIYLRTIICLAQVQIYTIFYLNKYFLPAAMQIYFHIKKISNYLICHAEGSDLTSFGYKKQKFNFEEQSYVNKWTMKTVQSVVFVTLVSLQNKIEIFMVGIANTNFCWRFHKKKLYCKFH